MSSHRRNIYLQKKTLEDARKTVIEAFAEKSPGKQWISTLDGAGRVLAEPVFAAVSSPNFHAAAMDGVAVKAANTFGAAETRPLNLQLGETAFPVNTGHIIPEGTDAVIMIEQINWVENDWIEIEAPVYPWQNVRKMGEDIVATELVFPRNHKITPHCLGAIITAGISSVCVWKKPTVLILPTGSELVDLTAVDPQALPKGKVIDSNSHMLGQMVEACGGTYRRHDLVADVTKAIREAIENANTDDIDLILILGGSSAGSEDYARAVIEELGSVLVHGVTMMPGKPVIAGQINGKPVFGMPGYPVSAIIAFEQLVQPIVYQMLHQTEPEARRINALPTRKLASKLGVEEFIRIKLGKVGDNIVATPLPRGAGCITSFTEADGIIRVPNAVEGVDANTPVPVELLRPLSSIYNTLVCVGSHDNTLDILSDMVREKSRQTTLSSSHVGSMGGLMAIKKGLCHIAGTHLLDTSDGNYNISYIKRYLPKRSVHLIHLVKRDQGLIVQPGNPKNIKNIKDLARPDVQFINRQGGSGTRILLDYRLSELGLKPEAISGYSNEEYTHMAVAVAVLSGAADVGLGIHAAAKALNLEFIPVVTESYELVIPDEFIEKPEIRLLLDIIDSAEFKLRVTALGGYHLKHTGTWVWKNC